eukprot:356031-Chlamydomonas_euryale.AAC.15
MVGRGKLGGEVVEVVGGLVRHLHCAVRAHEDAQLVSASARRACSKGEFPEESEGLGRLA